MQVYLPGKADEKRHHWQELLDSSKGTGTAYWCLENESQIGAGRFEVKNWS